MDIPDHILCFHSRYGIRDISGGAGAMKDYPLSLLLYTLGVRFYRGGLGHEV